MGQKCRYLVLLTGLTVLGLAVVGTLIVEQTKAEYDAYELEGFIPGDLTIVEPKNTTYTNIVPLTIQTTPWSFEPNSKFYHAQPMGQGYSYSINGQANITITNTTPPTILLTELDPGNHSIVVYTYFYFGMGQMWGPYGYSSEPAYFNVIKTNITIQEPQNKTYHTQTIPLSFTTKNPSTTLTYSLNNKANLTLTQNTTLTNLPHGSHQITIYADNTVASQTIHFTIQIPPTTLTLTITTILAVTLGIMLCIYKKRYNKTHGKKFFAITFSLLFTIILVFCCFVYTLNNVSHLARDQPIGVVVNDELELRDAINNASGPTIIALNKDITLKETLQISAAKDITLTSNRAEGFYKLLGSDEYTIAVVDRGMLRLAGIIVTHTKGTEGVGVGVFNGELFMLDGEISGNTHSASGGGVYIDTGVFVMSGGRITNNKVLGEGGGVCLYRLASFVMTGGSISGNSAALGGGVYAGSGAVNMSGGEIIGNTANEGGGVYVYRQASFSWSGGMISDNTNGDTYNISDTQ